MTTTTLRHDAFSAEHRASDALRKEHSRRESAAYIAATDAEFSERLEAANSSARAVQVVINRKMKPSEALTELGDDDRDGRIAAALLE